ncbi:DUF4258 domain-containing protein [Enterocloster citroniae]
MDIELLCTLINQGKIKWAQHCLSRLQERDISIADALNCVNSGEIIEDYPDDFPYPSCLIFGYTINNQIIHVVVGTDKEYAYMITAYFPNTIKFDDDLKTRRRS